MLQILEIDDLLANIQINGAQLNWLLMKALAGSLAF